MGVKEGIEVLRSVIAGTEASVKANGDSYDTITRVLDSHEKLHEACLAALTLLRGSGFTANSPTVIQLTEALKGIEK